MIQKETSVSIYVIDKELRIVFFNEMLAKDIPDIKVGAFCYEAICGEKEPCRNCPLLEKYKSSSMFYNRKTGTWIEKFHGEIQWPGAGSCTILFAKRLDEGNRNLLYNLTRISAYDELFELNLTKNTYKLLINQEGKYVTPPREGVLDEVVSEMCDHMIHPDDRERFLEFWDIEQMRDTLWCSEGAMRKGEFRKKMQCGDYCWTSHIAVPMDYADEMIVVCFIQDIQEQKEREQNQIPKIDELTGLYLKNEFYEKVQEFLEQKSSKEYCMMAIDIEHFKLFNDWYGRETGDGFLKKIGEYLLSLQREGHCVAGYAGNDDFMILTPVDWDLLSEIQRQLILFAKEQGNNIGFLPAFGVYQIEQDGERISTMHDRAIIAMGSVKGNYASRVSVYHSSMKKKMEDDQVLLSEIQRALEQKEFIFYVQPKCSMVSGKIVGMESLIRWQHPIRGLVPPSEFIPILENNGFIANLDLYVWESVCQHVKKWIAYGYHAIPISVNVSRVDIYAMDVVQVFKELVEKYELEPRMIEIEITESAYVENYDVISGTVNDLRQAGFTVLMDDFGSGYSSLNMLRDVNVDVLKIDMKFLDMTENSFSRGAGILEAIVKMARLMRLRLIAEGVETKEQAAFLLDIGCMYAQGYYYYRPMPVEAFEELLKDGEMIDYKGIRSRQIERIRVTDLFTENLASESIIDHILGGVALYDLHHGELKLLNANEQYLEMTGDKFTDLEEMNDPVLNYVYEEDRESVQNGFLKAMENSVEGEEVTFRRYRKDGSLMWMSVRVFFLREQDGHYLFYGGVTDVTEKKQKEEQLASSQKTLKTALNNMDISETMEAQMKLSEANIRLQRQNLDLEYLYSKMPGGYFRCKKKKDFEFDYISDRYAQILGYTKEEIQQSFGSKIINMIHPDDRQRVIDSIFSPVGRTPYILEYRIQSNHGYIAVREQSDILEWAGEELLCGMIINSGGEF